MTLQPRVAANAETAAMFFTDVPRDSYYFDAVRWAVENGVTNGTTATTFSPGNTCTRAQVVTFFWRNAGQPEPSGWTNPFSDVQEDSYYYKAMLWAVENGVTNGTSATTFSPNQPCSYAHVVTFLWRLENPGESDQEEDPWYALPATWADSNGLLAGTNFVPDQPCPRSDIVTYLYRNGLDSIRVVMSIEGDDLAYAVISAYSGEHTLWTHVTEAYELTEVTTIDPIGVFGGQYLYVENGRVVALDLRTGEVRWKNDDFIGGVSGYCVGKNGVLYLCSSEGNGFFGVDMTGKTAGSLGFFFDENDRLLRPFGIQRVDESHMSVLVSGSDLEAYRKRAFLVDLRDFSYEGPFDLNDSRVAPRVEPFLTGAWIRDEPRVSRIDVKQVDDLYLFDVSWKGGHSWSFSGKWENGVIHYTNGVYSHRDSEFEWGQTGTVRLAVNTLIWTQEDSADPIEYVRFYEAY